MASKELPRQMPPKSGPDDTADRRQHPRVSIAVEIDFRSEHNFYAARAQDLSLGGLFIQTDVGLPIGSRLTVDLKLMKQHLRVESEVVWVLVGDDEQPAGAGVRFVDITGAAKRSIEAFMAVRKPISFEMFAGEEVEPDEDPKAPSPSDRNEKP
jgi:uncharacterized protein (TIGR02266 family)